MLELVDAALPVWIEEVAMADSDSKAKLAALRLDIIKQIEIADQLGEPHLAAILCEAEACIDKLIAR